MTTPRSDPGVAVLMPALDEEEALPAILSAIPEWIETVVVADNGSSNGTAEEKDVLAQTHALGAELGVAFQASLGADPLEACVRPWTMAYVTANGNYLPCCFGPWTTTRYADLFFGNLLEQDFVSIWNDAPYREWREALLTPTPKPACRGCGVCWSL